MKSYYPFGFAGACEFQDIRILFDALRNGEARIQNRRLKTPRQCQDMCAKRSSLSRSYWEKVLIDFQTVDAFLRKFKRREENSIDDTRPTHRNAKTYAQG
jgi:hypothetical protein